MKHTAVFTAARDALALLTAEPEQLATAATYEAVCLTAEAALEVTGGAELSGTLPAPSNPQPVAILTAARDVLGEYAGRELPAWGSAEALNLYAPLAYAFHVLDLLNTAQTPSGAAQTDAPSEGEASN